MSKPYLPHVRPVLDGRTPVYLEVGADPTVAPGMQLPPGSVVRFGATYYFKTGPLATDWTLTTNLGGAGFTGLAGVTAPLTGIGTAPSPLAMPAATAGAPGYMTAAQAGFIAAGGLGWKNRTIARAIAKAGIADDRLVVIDYEGGGMNNSATANTSWTAVTIAGGDVNYSNLNADRGALTRFSRLTTTGTVHIQRNCAGLIAGAAATGIRWYFRFRLKMGSLAGMGASAVIGLGASNNFAHTNFIDVGCVAANSTTKWSARLTGTTTLNLISTVNMDATARWIELWCDGTNTFLSVDDETPLSGAYVAFTIPPRPNLCYILDGTAGTREFTIDRGFWSAEESA